MYLQNKYHAALMLLHFVNLIFNKNLLFISPNLDLLVHTLTSAGCRWWWDSYTHASIHQYALFLHVHMKLRNISPHLKSVQQKPLEHRNIISISHRKETETPCPALSGTTSIEFLEVRALKVKANKRIIFKQGFQIQSQGATVYQHLTRESRVFQLPVCVPCWASKVEVTVFLQWISLSPNKGAAYCSHIQQYEFCFVFWSLLTSECVSPPQDILRPWRHWRTHTAQVWQCGHSFVNIDIL